jgi:predicted polyphosphate/ATP-dependent NAD kinase
VQPIGIIANPSSGKDIRRLVGYGSVFENYEKVNIVKRLLLGMDSVGVRDVFFMPDQFGICSRALEELDISLRAVPINMEVEASQIDSMRAAALMAKQEVACIITLGGDGTNRIISKSCGDTPLLPIAAGTNNVFPMVMEGTIAGIVAGIISKNSFPVEGNLCRAPRLEIYRGTDLIDIALVDVVVSSSYFIGSRAVWDMSTLQEIFLSRSEPNKIGFSSVGGHLCPLLSDSGKGLHIVIGSGNIKVRAPIAPGLIRTLPVSSYRTFKPGERILINSSSSTVALDGEREISIKEGDQLIVQINVEGPLVVDVGKVLTEASGHKLFIKGGKNFNRIDISATDSSKAKRRLMINENV